MGIMWNDEPEPRPRHPEDEDPRPDPEMQIFAWKVIAHLRQLNAEAGVARRLDEIAKRTADLLLPKITRLIERKFAELTETLVLLNRKL